MIYSDACDNLLRNLILLQACCVEYLILESDNLSSVFPNAHLSLGGLHLNSHYLFALLSTLAVLPTVWLRDLTILSYVSGDSDTLFPVSIVTAFFYNVNNFGFHLNKV